jgi:hypothetical protein
VTVRGYVIPANTPAVSTEGRVTLVGLTSASRTETKAPPSLLPIYVGRTDLSGVQIAVPVTKCVPGSVTVEGDGPIPALFFSLAGLSNTGTSRPSSAIVFPRSDGSFRVLLPEGERRITLNTQSLPSGYSLKSFTYGSTDLLRDPLRVSGADSSSLALTFAAAPGSWSDVSGRVTGIDPTVRTYTVQMNQRDMVARVRPDGSFSFFKVLRGSHAVELTASGGIPVSKSIVIAGQDIVGFEIAAPPQREVVGRMTMEGGGLRFVSFDLVLTGQGGTMSIRASAGTDGVFKIALPIGESKVSVRGIAPASLKSLTYGSTDLLKEPLRVSATDAAELRATVATGTTSGGGVVVGGVFGDGPNSCDMPGGVR